MNMFRIVLIAYSLMSLVTFVLYGADKCRAKRKKRRIRESVLLGCSFFGGAVGALLGMNCFRHKTKHWYFWAVVLLGSAWQAALVILLRMR